MLFAIQAQTHQTLIFIEDEQPNEINSQEIRLLVSVHRRVRNISCKVRHTGKGQERNQTKEDEDYLFRTEIIETGVLSVKEKDSVCLLKRSNVENSILARTHTQTRTLRERTRKDAAEKENKIIKAKWFKTSNDMRINMYVYMYLDFSVISCLIK